ncbi:MAG: DUF1573 domain-containing protein [Verrucomicrobiales bacterium]|nr:DUF1573 domain-containing protein [Verrucomicrobiales bacterium]
MKRVLTALALWAGLGVFGFAGGAPKIQFDTTVFDFGKTSQVETVSGTFKFMNAGDAVLKIEQPKPQCGCTIASLKKNTLEPGESGEIPFTLNLGRSKIRLEKRITVNSNDPQTPQVSLTIKADYTPLYDIAPMSLAANIPLGGLVTNLTITRTDGKPLPALKIQTSKPWITAQVDPSVKTDDGAARVRVEFQADGPPRRLSEFIQVYLADQTNAPLSTVMIYGRVMGELTVSPEALYWSVTDPVKIKTERPEALITRRVSIKSSRGQEFTVKNAQSSVKGINLELVPREWKKPVPPGKPEEVEKGYELIARMAEIPEKTITGNVSIETSLAAQPKIELPVQIYVFQPAAQQPRAAVVQPAPQPRISTNAARLTGALPANNLPPLPPASK